MTRCRKNVAQLTPTEKSQLVQAFLDLKDPVKSPSKIPAAAAAVTAKGGTPNRYDDYVWMHNQVGFGAHRGPAFGPWHREFLYQLEHDLGLAAGDPDLALPYWDWINARDSSSPGWPFTNDLMGGFGDLGPGATTGFVGAGPFSNPATWRMNVRLSGDNDTTLKRSRGVPAASALPARSTVLRMFGIGIGPGVTWPTVYDGTPLNDSNTNPTSTQVFSSLRKYLERFLHDGVHGWVGDAWELDAQGNPHDGGHMSFPSVSVNDPVFFLHHCNVDRLWSIWQRKVGGAYIPQSGGPGGHNGGDLMVNLADPTWFNAPLHAHPNDVADHQALGYWYHTDQPDITLDTPSVAFGSVPELTTTFMPVMFTIRTCQPVRFEVTAVTGTGFAVAAGQGIVIVDDDHDSDTVTGRVYVQYTANGALNTPVPGTATVVASIVDTDGYDTANPGDVLVLGSWTVDLTATSVSRPKAAIGLVLDRSGSMSLSAGVAGSRYDMLKASLNVLRDVMRPIDGVAVVTFDDVTSTLNPVLALGPAVDPAGPGTGRAALDTAIASPDLVPRNMTGIGQGLIDAAAVLDTERLDPSTPYQRFALCVMTDGNENVDPKVADPLVTAAIAPYADAIYAIGLGQPGGVSDAVLTSISNYMLITGDITAAERRFRLTKYFIQILAGVTRTAIVVDPQGDLAVGSEHRIPFVLHDSDLEVDVIVLSPLAPLIEFSLVAPDGTEIDAGFGAPTVEFHEHQEDAFYRLTVPVAPTVPRAGRWTAVLRLSKEAMTKADGRDDWREVLQQLARHGTLPYSLIVQSYSDLLLDVAVKPSLCLAGETVALAATLTANGQPLEDLASVTVAVTDPNGKEFRVRLSGDGRGGFTGSMVAAVPGAYSCRFVASGGRGRIATFQREETRTVVAYRGEFPPGVGDPADDKQQKRVVHPRPAGRIELLARPVADVALRPARQLRRERDMPDHQMADHPDDDQAGAGAAAGAAEVHDHGAADEHDEHGDHGGHAGMDHERMVFTVFRPVGEDGIEELRADEIERDPSGYDEDGRDTGVGPDRVPPPEPGEHDHHH